MPFVSVIVPCYNQGKFLAETLDSVLRQTHLDWECIVVNDGSTDQTEEVALAWSKRDSRFRYAYKENGGLSSARNAGLALAQGDFLQFLDADDLAAPSKFSRQLKDLEEKPEGTIAISDHFPFDHQTKAFAPRMYISPFLNERDFKKEIITEWEFRRSIPPHSPLVLRKLVTANRLSFSESLPTHEDWAFWCQLFYHAEGICYQKEQLAKFRMHNTSMSNNKELMAQGFLAATFVLETFYNRLGEPDYIRCVRKMRKEVKNNLFAHHPLYNYYAEMKKRMKYYFNLQNS